MTRSTVVVGSRSFTVSGLEPRAAGEIHQAVVAAQFVDRTTLRPVSGRTQVSTSVAGLRGQTTDSGFVGLVGRPTRALPGLRTAPKDVDLLVEVEGYLSRREVVRFTPQSGFPGSFAPRDLGVVQLTRAPVTVQLATYELDPMLRPVALGGVTVRITQVWPTTASLGTGPSVTDVVAVTPGLSSARRLPATVVVPVLTTPVEPARRLLRSAEPGEQVIVVSRRGALGVGDLVGLDLADAERAERVEVMAIDGPVDVESPADLGLRFPLMSTHQEGADAVRITVPGPDSPPVNLTSEAAAGDRTLRVTSTTGLAPGQVIRIDDVTPGEYRRCDLYRAVTDSQGVGRFPPITGLAAVELTAASGALGATAQVSLVQQPAAIDLTLT